MPLKPDPVWILFRRRTFSRISYWIQFLGFDLRDRSFGNKIYFVYFCAFWLAWGVAVVAIFGSVLAESLAFIPESSSPALATLVGAIVLTVWGLYNFWQVLGRSPFVFSESDAYYLCQAPVNRRKVGLAWFLMDWFGTVLPFAFGAFIVSYALTYIALSGVSNFQSLPTYFASSFRSLAIILPLQMGLQAGLYGVGAWRLRRDRPPRRLFGLRLSVLFLAISFLATLFFPTGRVILLAPMTFPLQAAFGDVASSSVLLFQAGLPWLILGLGITSLLFWTDRMHLGRSAQETRLESVIRPARSFMNFELVEALQNQSKMSVTYAPSRLPVKGGVWMLVWKNLIQSWRSLRVSKVLSWLYAFFLGIGVFLSSSWVVQLILGGFWAVSLGNLVTDRLRNDLANWWLLRSLPFQNSNLLLALLAPASGLGVLLGWLALALTSPPTAYSWLTAALLPFLVACAALGSTQDILDHAKASVLMAPSIAKENVPRQDIQGVLVTLIAVGLPLGLLTWSSSQPDGFLWGLLSLPVAGLITIFLLKSTLRVFRWIT